LLDLAKGRSAAMIDRGIDLQVSRLRRKIECNPRKPELIKTAWGDGYVLTSRVTSE
jgi:two-component system OmpR family response regulator